jgi:transcriptional regulator with XRE-family HTH domain
MKSALLARPNPGTVCMNTEPEQLTTLGIWIRDAMSERGWLQTDLAKASGMGQSTISSWMTGLRRPRKVEDLEPLVRALFLGDTAGEEYETFSAAAIRAAWPSPPTKEEIRALRAIPIAEAYWNLPARDKSIVDQILYTDVHTGQQYTMDDINQMLEDDK